MGLFDKLFGKTESKASAHELITYKGFTVQPSPTQKQGGWSTEATIRKVDDAENREHHFIRADTCPTEASAVELITSKCSVLIDQRGDKLFD